MQAYVILNPYAGRWKALELRPQIEDCLSKAGIVYTLVVTEGPGHASTLAAAAVKQGHENIIAAGGDGTISEIVNGLITEDGDKSAHPRIRFGIMPAGTANDFVINLGLPVDLPGAATVIASGKTAFIDIGQVSHGSPARSRYFDNNSAIGLEPTVTLIQQGITHLRGTLRYLLATLLAVAKKPSWHAHLEWQDGEYDGPVSLVTVGNNPLTGGLFYMTPHANPFDGLLTFVYGYLPTRRRILSILPRTMKPGAGSYVEHPDIHEVHSPWLRIHTTTPTPLHADGEIQTEKALSIEYSVLPARLPVFVK